MTARRSTAIAALPLAALAVAGCGIGAGRDLGEAGLTVTRDFGARRVAGPVGEPVTEADTVIRLLERKATISTRYGGGFVQSIDGIEGTERGGRRYDWFFYVDGVEATVGAADYPLHGGDAVWWDYREWSATAAVPAVVGSWPQPFAGDGDTSGAPTAIECLGGRPVCLRARRRLEAAGALLGPPDSVIASGVSESPPHGARSEGVIRVIVGPWWALREDPAAARIEDGPQASGVFAAFRRAGGSFELWGLDEAGAPARRFGPKAGLVAATRRGEAPPVWIVTGAGEAGVRAAAGLLASRYLRDRYAVAVEGDELESLPLR